MSRCLYDLLGSLGCHAGSEQLTGKRGAGEEGPHNKTLL